MEVPWCCYSQATPRLKSISLLFAFIETLELLRIILITEWLITPRWEKTIILEIVLLLLLLICNLLLFIGAARQKPFELIPWLAGHGIFLGVQVVLIVFYTVTIFMTSTPSTQNHWLNLPRGMTSVNPEFQQRLRWTLGVNIGKMAVLVITSIITAYCLRIVFQDRLTMKEEVEHTQAQYQVKAEYKQDGARRGSISNVPVRNSYRRTVREDVYNIPLTVSSMIPNSGGVGRERERGLPAHQSVDPGYSRQTSQDTTYNVPSIRTEVTGPVVPRFDSIREMEGEIEGKRNEGYLL